MILTDISILGGYIILAGNYFGGRNHGRKGLQCTVYIEKELYFFFSDTMVFVSPPPTEKSKAVAPIMPFNIYVSLSIQNKIEFL